MAPADANPAAVARKIRFARGAPKRSTVPSKAASDSRSPCRPASPPARSPIYRRRRFTLPATPAATPTSPPGTSSSTTSISPSPAHNATTTPHPCNPAHSNQAPAIAAKGIPQRMARTASDGRLSHSFVRQLCQHNLRRYQLRSLTRGFFPLRHRRPADA